MEDSSKSQPKKEGPAKNLSMFDIGDESTGLSITAIPSHSDLKESSFEGLNIEQKQMVSNISEYLKGRSGLAFFLVQGGGGTGKSFSINRALQGVDPKHIIAAAPSHFAKNVLQDFLGERYKVTTIAGLLGKKVTYNDQGDQILVRINKFVPPPINFYQIILIDEGSMVNDETAVEILEYVKTGNKALIVLGDYCQLPPVNQETDSIFFDNISAELTIPMRFQGPLFYLTQLIRKEIIKMRSGLVPSLNILNMETNRLSELDESGSGYIFLNNMPLLLKAAIRRFKKGKGTGYVRLLAYRNKTIEKLNVHIRIGLYGESPMQFEKGELLINNGGYSVQSVTGKDKQIITNGELFKVSSATPVIGPYEIPCISLTFEGESFDVSIVAVSTEGEEKYSNTLKRLTGLARENGQLWRDVFAFKESFAYFNYSYAASIHKAQGSSINHVFIIEDDILEVKMTTTKEKLQSIYVGISRASYRAYIYNKLFKVDNSNLEKELLQMDVP
jgi:hypothetical protein